MHILKKLIVFFVKIVYVWVTPLNVFHHVERIFTLILLLL